MNSNRLSEVTCPQAVGSDTFRPPPLDRLLAFPEIVDWHGLHSHHHPLFVYYDDSSQNIARIQWGDAAQAVYRIANAVHRVVSAKGCTDGVRPVVGLFASTTGLCQSAHFLQRSTSTQTPPCIADSFWYNLHMTGIMRAGYTAFLISAVTSPIVLDHVLSISNVTHVLLDDSG